MFWGLIMEPQKRYTQVIKKAFHISMASLDISNSDGQPSQVMCGYEDRNYLLCTLQKPGNIQCNLDLYFEEGTTVSFATNGKSHVHLTGYLTKEIDETEESDEESQEFEVKAQKKPLANEKGENEPIPQKKQKKQEAVEEEEDSDDSDVDMEKLMNAASDDELSEEESGDEEEGDLDEEGLDGDSLEEEEDDSSDDEGEVEEEEEEKKVKAMMNGLEKKSKEVQEKPKQTTPNDKQNKSKRSINLTPGPKAKKQESPKLNESQKKGKEEKKPKENQTPNSKKKTLPSGVIIEDLKEGQGDAATSGKFVHVYYEGRLKSNNKVFDKSHTGPGFGFRLGKGEVIKGWDIGVSGMKIGGKRRITCPPNLAYGGKGSPPVIPPNSTLIFEVELKKVK